MHGEDKPGTTLRRGAEAVVEVRKDKLEKDRDETQGHKAGPDDVTATSGLMTEEEIGGGAAVRRKLTWSLACLAWFDSELRAQRAEGLPA